VRSDGWFHPTSESLVEGENGTTGPEPREQEPQRAKLSKRTGTDLQGQAAETGLTGSAEQKHGNEPAEMRLRGWSRRNEGEATETRLRSTQTASPEPHPNHRPAGVCAGTR
jgi:hypothetical protein